MATTPRAPATATKGRNAGNQSGGAPEKDVAPHHRGAEACGQADPARQGAAALPEAHGGDPDEAAERRREGHQVVRVDDALGQADDEAGGDERSAPQQQCGALAVGAAGPDGDGEQDGAHHERAGQEPRHHVPELGVEEPGETGRAPHAPGDPAAAHAAGLVAR